MSAQQPSITRIVVFRDQTRGGLDSPAIITRVWGPTCVNLKVLPDCAPVYDVTSQVLIVPEFQSAHGWFWPPRLAE